MDIVADLSAIRARFLDQFNTNSVTTLFENAPAQEIDVTQPFVRFGITPLNVSRLTFGTGNHEAQGIITLQVFVPDAAGQTLAHQLAAPFITAFQDWRSADGAIWCNSAQIREVPRKTGDPYQVNFMVHYISDR